MGSAKMWGNLSSTDAICEGIGEVEGGGEDNTGVVVVVIWNRADIL